jgi:hypothetical protein
MTVPRQILYLLAGNRCNPLIAQKLFSREAYTRGSWLDGADGSDETPDYGMKEVRWTYHISY